MTKTHVDTGNPWTWTLRQNTSEREIRRTVALENEVARLKAANELLRTSRGGRMTETRSYPDWMKRHPDWIAKVERGGRYLAEDADRRRESAN